MSLTNYSDISKRGASVRAGFQFEFRCHCCSQTWSSPFKPYRRGRLAGILAGAARLIPGFGVVTPATRRIADLGEQRAWESARDSALELAQERYVECAECGKMACEQCWDPDARRCARCRGGNGRSTTSEGATAAAGAPADSAGLRCPNCSAGLGGGRFCPECGFDMASTHKSCPGCGALCTRATRYCTDCGHGF